jgi:hypothetical protein
LGAYPVGTPVQARPRHTLEAGEQRSLTIEDLFCHWQNLGPGAYVASIRLGLGDTTTGPLALRLRFTP